MRIASGALKGKEAVRSYWEPAFAASTPLRFELHDVVAGMNAIAIYYRNVSRGRMVVEILTLNERREITSGMALYGEPGG